MAKLNWDTDAEQALKRAPFFVRPLARRKVEERVRQGGRERVTLADVREAEARFKAVRGDKSDAELAQLVPQPNRPGTAMLVVEACRSELSNCPNVVLPTRPYVEAVEQWAEEQDISERLRRRVRGDRVLFHHKFRIAIAGCPNGCSRPQIADVGLIGFARPEVDTEACILCGACARACPDGAVTVHESPAVFDRDRCLGCRVCHDACPQECITLSEPQARVMLAGKLGRHPHLAETVAEISRPAELVELLDETVSDFLAKSRLGERFPDYWLRARKVYNG
jgi:dissimilatory sulfite reductase (desulfoviridin) alpha/beta subunit